MNPKLKRIVFPLGAFVALVALACTCGGSGGISTPTPLPPPTSGPPTKPPVILPTESSATKPPIGGNGGGAPFEVDSQPYTHSESGGAFSTLLPSGWKVEERADGIFVTEPNGPGTIDVSFTHVGVELTEEQLTNFIDGIEQNWFATFQDYQEISREPQQDGSILVLKSLTSEDTSYDVFSYYWHKGTVVYEQDFWTTSDQYDAYVDGFVEIANSIETNESAAEESRLYNSRYTFNCPEDLCKFSIPYAWTYLRDEQYTSTIIDQFKSPDRQTFVENVIYDDGNTISKSVAGRFALGLLKEFYDVNDIVVTDDQTQPDGSERLSWYSKSGGYSGQSFFETRGTTFLMLTWVANDAAYDLYSPVWGTLLDTYDSSP